MKNLSKQAGSTVIEIALGVLVIGLLAFVGYTYWVNSQPKSAMNDTKTTSKSEEIKKASDLDNETKALDATDLDKENSSDLDAMDKELNTF
jgi:hypothetical protein